MGKVGKAQEGHAEFENHRITPRGTTTSKHGVVISSSRSMTGGRRHRGVAGVRSFTPAPETFSNAVTTRMMTDEEREKYTIHKVAPKCVSEYLQETLGLPKSMFKNKSAWFDDDVHPHFAVFAMQAKRGTYSKGVCFACNASMETDDFDTAVKALEENKKWSVSHHNGRFVTVVPA